MPAPPQLSERGGEIWAVEVFPQPEPHDLSRPDRDVGVSGEIAIDLEGESDCREHEWEAHVFVRTRIDGVDDSGQVVGDHDLLEHSPEHSLEPSSDFARAERVQLPKLGQEVLWTLDRPGDELRIEHDIQCKDPEVILRHVTAPIHLDRVAHSLERMKGQADRENDLESGDGIVPAEERDKAGEVRAEEVEVLKDEEHAYVRGDASGEEGSPSWPGRPRDQNARCVVDDDGESEDQDVGRDEGHVKGAARHKEKDPPLRVRKKEIERGDDREVEEEGKGIENHGSSRLPTKSTQGDFVERAAAGLP